MKDKILIKSDLYDIPAIISYPIEDRKVPIVILCHGTGGSKDENGNLFVKLAKVLNENGIACIRFDFAGCGESLAKKQDLTFYGEVDDVEKVYRYILKDEKIDPNRIGILGFSQGARVMAEFLGRYPKEINAAVSWSGVCHNGEGVFAQLFEKYYEEAARNGYAKIQMSWIDNLILSKKWFDEIRDSNPMDSLSKYKGAILTMTGAKDVLVPSIHGGEIIEVCGGKVCEARLIGHANHIFNVRDKDQYIVNKVIKDTVDWISLNI